MSTTKLKDIAEAAGVSINTVSRVLSGKTKGQYASSAVKVQRIMELARKMEYTPNKIAQAMRTRRTYQIGMIVSELHNPYTSRTLTIVNSELTKHGYGMVLRLIHQDEDIKAALRAYSKNLMDGLLSNHPFIPTDMLEEMMPGIPIVTLDRSSEYSPATINLESGVLLGMQHLWNLGHEKIAIITGYSHLKGRSRRLDAYHSFYASHGIEPPKEWIMQKGWEYWNAVDFTDQLVASGCTACFAGNDLLGMGICTGLRMKGLEVPKDFSIVSMDDTVLSKMNYPELTSVRLPSHELVRLTIEGLLARIEGKKIPPFRQLMPSLIVRSSAALRE